MDDKQHWEAVYESKAPNAVSWYTPHLRRSLAYIMAAAPDRKSKVIDVGGGESTLVDDLLAEGYSSLTVLDLSQKALDVTKQRLGASAEKVHWTAANVLDSQLPVQQYDVWHDRAVFHFLTNMEDRRRYVENVLQALDPHGFAIVATFGPHGPESCSGLPVVRYDANELHATFGDAFELVESSEEVHQTPWGSPQQFVYCFCRRANC